jgi:hypothetical protein
VFFIGQDIGGQGQATPGEHGDQTVLPQRTDETVERHGRDMMDHGAQLQTEAPVGSQQGIAGDLRPHLAVAQDMP